MRKGLIFAFLLICVFLVMPKIVLAETDFENMTENQRVNLAYDCLKSTVEEKECDELTTVEKIFSLLSVSECEEELWDDSKSDECWPKSSCDIKTTAQAMLALDKSNEDTEDAIEWLFDQKKVPEDLIWYLEVEARNASVCKVSYNKNTYTVNIAENKKIALGNFGSCLSISPNGYWLQINPSCTGFEYSITCNESFLTTLLFKQNKPDARTIHVLNKINSAPEDGTTIEQINSFCFSKAGVCDYEGTLWATMVLDKLGEEIESFVPYLVAGEKENRKYFPTPFLSILTDYSDYTKDILSRQINEQYWLVSNTKYYDTAVALLPFQGKELSEKTSSIEWLLEIQDESGCWDGKNIVSNGILLYSIWPRGYMGSGSGGSVNEDDNSTSDNNCQLSGYYCLNSGKCSGEILSAYSSSCSGIAICCSEPAQVTSCESISGVICGANEYCASPGTQKHTDDLSGSQVCCVGGTCKTKVIPVEEKPSCEDSFGLCEDFSCGAGYQETNSYSCANSGVCCMKLLDTGEKKSLWWIWVLLILIALVTLGIIFKEKLKELFSGEGREENNSHNLDSRRPGFPGNSSIRPNYPQPRKIIPSANPQNQMMSSRPMQQGMRPRPKSPKELDDVLRKLKDMSR